MTDTLLSWSSGKDSAWTLHVLRRVSGVRVCRLFTTVSERSDRVASHEVRRRLVEVQSEAAGLPVDFVPLPQPCSNADYEGAMSDYFRRMRRRGIEACAFGDLALQDVRRYREEMMRDSGLAPLFPIYGADTRALSREMVDAGLRALLVSVDSRRLSPAFLGREFNAALLAELPAGVDPCGENGEFHTFATEGPMFTRPVAVATGGTFERDGFVFADIRPA